MYLDFECPLELRGYELLHDDHGNVRAYLRLYNLASRRIANFEAIVIWRDEKGERTSSMPFVADQLRASARTEFTLSLSTGEFPQAAALRLRFTVIRFEDGSPDWTGDESRMRHVRLPESPSGRALNALVASAGADARFFPVRRHGYWICVCGRPNPYHAEKCVRCHRGRDVVLKNLTPSRVLSKNPPVLPGLLAPDPVSTVDIPLMQKKARSSVPSGQLRTLYQHYLRQRNLLIRRTITMLVIAALVALSAYVGPHLIHEWQRSREFVVPVKSAATPVPSKN